jgi:hypothetical protein
MTLATNMAGGSVIPAITVHAAFNSSFPILMGLMRGVASRGNGLEWYVVGAVSVAGVVVVLTRGRLGKSPHSPARRAVRIAMWFLRIPWMLHHPDRSCPFMSNVLVFATTRITHESDNTSFHEARVGLKSCRRQATGGH